jgi:hypothetical protein
MDCFVAEFIIGPAKGRPDPLAPRNDELSPYSAFSGGIARR